MKKGSRRYKKAGHEWEKQGHPVKVQTHDFPDPSVPKAMPYGVYDVGQNTFSIIPSLISPPRLLDSRAHFAYIF